MASKKETIAVKPVSLTTVVVRVKGVTPLIEHCWSEKSKRQMLESQMGMKDKAKKKDPKVPVEDFIRSLYWLSPMPTEFTEEGFKKAIDEGAHFGFPVTGFKQAAISGAYRKNWVPDKMTLRGTFFIETDGIAQDGTECVEIFSDVPVMREDMVKVGKGTADIRYRGEFRNWYADLKISYDSNGVYTIKDIVNYFNAAGFSVGVGEWRPERDGQFGLFEVVSN